MKSPVGGASPSVAVCMASRICEDFEPGAVERIMRTSLKAYTSETNLHKCPEQHDAALRLEVEAES